MVTSKKKKYKFPKNPSDFIYKEDVLNYIIDLEEKDSLDDLPENLLLYYVLATLINQVNNGGFAQYLTNHSGAGFPYIERVAKRLENAHVADLLNRFSHETKRYLGETKATDMDISDEFDDTLSALDDQFYELDEKYDIAKLNLKAYKSNYVAGAIEIPLVKERESETCRYMIADPDITLEDALISLCDYMSSFANSNWKIRLATSDEWGPVKDRYDMRAISDLRSYDLYEILNNFHSPQLLKFHGLSVTSIVRESQNPKIREQHMVQIQSSGFEKNEYKIKKKFCMGWVIGTQLDGKHPVTIDFSLSYDEFDIEEVKRILIELAPRYSCIQSIYTEHTKWKESAAKEVRTHYLK